MSIKQTVLLLFVHLGLAVHAQPKVTVNPSVLNVSHTLQLAESYMEYYKRPEAIWVLINTLKHETDTVRAKALALQIKSGKTDSEFIQLVEDVFWAYIPHIHLIPDSDTAVFHVFEDYFFWKNELIAFATEHGKKALQLDEQAQQQMAQGKLTDAVKSYSASLELIPDARRYYRRAQLYEALDENRLALNDYDSSIRLHPFSIHYLRRGELNLRLRHLDDAIRDFSAVIDSQFEYLLHRAYYNRALCYALKGELNSDKKSLELSIPDFTKAIELHPTADAYKRRGMSYYEIENMEASKKDLIRAIEFNPNDADCYFFLVAFENNFKKSIALLDKSIELNPYLHQAYSLRGITYYNKGKKKKACEDFQTAMELGNENALKNYNNKCRNRK